MKVKLLAENAVLPQKAHESDAGYDLVATSKVEDGEKRQITYGFGLAVAIPEGKVGLIFQRSSVRKTDLSLANAVGVIDSGFLGEITATFNMLNEDVPTKKKTYYKVGERIAQIMIVDLSKETVEQVEEFDEVTARGEGGYGSSGSAPLEKTKVKLPSTEGPQKVQESFKETISKEPSDKIMEVLSEPKRRKINEIKNDMQEIMDRKPTENELTELAEKLNDKGEK